MHKYSLWCQLFFGAFGGKDGRIPYGEVIEMCKSSKKKPTKKKKEEEEW